MHYQVSCADTRLVSALASSKMFKDDKCYIDVAADFKSFAEYIFPRLNFSTRTTDDESVF